MLFALLLAVVSLLQLRPGGHTVEDGCQKPVDSALSLIIAVADPQSVFSSRPKRVGNYRGKIYKSLMLR